MIFMMSTMITKYCGAELKKKMRPHYGVWVVVETGQWVFECNNNEKGQDNNDNDQVGNINHIEMSPLMS